ncbi:MAG: prealbumin-like fold domain-containing protein [Oscillospiraceae bacterium]|nr:prealbumin-like fold domain-containing protein [Oscillospiraceae bacterium]
MRNTLMIYIDRFRHDRRERLVLGSVLLVLALIVTLVVYWQLRYTGITMTNETFCGYEEHIHTEECYEYTLVCGLEETEGHTHSEECYDEEENLICELEECEPHTHTEECYEKTLTCELSEHTHSVECLINLNADVEDATIWEATLPELTGDIRTDVASIAYSQLGYTESTANYSIGEDEITRYGYTRYGTWYGNSYADWDSMFAAFCLDYAGIEDEFTYNAGAYAWSVDLTNLGYYQSADSYVPSRGDIVFIDTDNDGKANVSAIVVSIDETAETITVIQGNYSVTDNDGNTTDIVAFVTYSTAVETVEEILAESGIATLSAETEAVETEEIDETEEITPVILGYANVTLTSEEKTEEIVDEEETEEILDEDSADEPEEEIELDGEESEEILEETEESDEPEELEEVEETEELEGETLLLTAASTDYVTQVNELYTIGMSLTTGDTSTASTIWDTLMTIWEQIYAEEEAGTLTLTAEEYDNVNALTDEVYYYFVETVGYDPFGLVTADENGEDNGSEENGETGNTNGTLTATSTYELTDYAVLDWGYEKVTYDSGTFTINSNITFDGLTKEEIVDANYTFNLSVPSGVEIADILIGVPVDGTVNGYSGNAFTFTIYGDGSGGYYIKVDFNENYITTLAENSTLSGYMKFKATFGLDDIDTTNPEKVVVGTSQELQITIGAEDIETTDPGDNWLADLTVVKSAGSYNSTYNTITYTVTVWSEKGTNGNKITLDDVLTITNFSSYINTDVTIKSIDVNSVTYYPCYGWDNLMTWAAAAETVDSSEYEIDTNGNTLTVTLPALIGKSDTYSSYDYQGDCYVIEYTVTLDPESAEYYSEIANKATATTESEGGTVTDYDIETKTVSSHVVSKTGKYSSTTNTVTWTITLNTTGTADVAGYVLTDQMLSQAIAKSLTITNSSGTTSSGEYTINYVKDNSGDPTDVIESITFNATDTDGDNDSDTNTNTYTITYQTSTDATLGDPSSSQTNKVTVEDENCEEVSGDSETTSISGGGSLYKEFVSATAAEPDGSKYTRDVEWKTTVYVPAGGISAGTELYDYIGTSSNDTSNHTAAETYQWFTYTQIKTFFDGLAENGITIGSDNVGYSYDDAYGVTQYRFSLKAYDSNTGDWVSYSDLIGANAEDYKSHVFTAYCITFLENVTYSGTATLGYTTTVDVSDVQNNVVISQTYYNAAHVGNLTASASYTDSKTVTKTDGSGNSDKSTVTISDTGYLTWIVKVFIPSGSTDEYTVTDYLPAGLEFVSATVTMNWQSTTLTSTNTSGTLVYQGGTVTLSTSGNSTSGTDVVIKFGSDVYSQVLSSSDRYATITYTVKIADFDPDSLDNSSYTYDDNADGSKTYTIVPTGETGYTNKVEVKWGSNSDEDEQTQTPTYTVKEEQQTPETTDHDTVSKSGSFNQATGQITYEVVLNIDEDTLNNGKYLTFTDVASCFSNEYFGTIISLSPGSVYFYQLCELLPEDDNNGYLYYYDNTGTKQYYLVNGEKTSTVDTTDSSIYSMTETTQNGSETTYYYKVDLELAWTYSEENNSGNVQHTITSKVIPDSTAILVTYKYDVYTASGRNETITVNNTATLTGDDDSGSSTGEYTNGNWKEPTASAGLVADGGLTIIKVDENNYNTTIPDTKFALYKLVNGDWVQVTADDFDKCFKSDDSTRTTYEISNLDTSCVNPMDENNYLTTDSAGQITISRLCYYDDVSGTSYFYSWYDPWTLYYIVEVDAADGYTIIESEIIYFYWSDGSGGSLTYPAGFNQYTTTHLDLTTYPSTEYVKNGEQTSFTLTKISTSDSSTIAGAVFALYEWDNSKDDWVRIGTYETDKNGQIIIAYDEDLYTFNKAYKLTEITPADGYNIGYDDVTTFYFWWSSSDDTTYPHYYPSDWGGSTSKNYSTVYDISHSSGSVKATNTKTTTSVSVTKAWVDTNGNVITDETELDGYSSNVQLYYYLLDENGNTPSGTSTSTELITLSISTGTTADTTVTLYSYTGSIQLSDTTWTSLDLSASNIISAIYDNDYTDGYVEVYVVGGENPSNMGLVLQNSSWGSLANVSPSKVITTNEGTQSYYTVRYSLSSIKSALESAGKTSSDVAAFSIDASSVGTAGTMQYFKVIGNAKTLETDGTSNTYTVTTTTQPDGSTETTSSGTWMSYFYNWKDSQPGASKDLSNLQEDGVVLAIDYSGATAGTQIYIQVWLTTSTDSGIGGRAITLPDTSGTVYVKLSDMIGDNFDWSTYNQIAIQPITWNKNSTDCTSGTTINSVTVLVPATTTTTSTTYTYAETDSNTQTLSNWTKYLALENYGAYGYDRTLYSVVSDALQEDGALIYITYSSTDETVTVGLQSYNNDATVKDGYASSNVTFADTNGGTSSTYIAVSDLSGIASFDWDYCNLVYLQGSSATTVYSVSVLVPYEASESISGVIASGDIYVETFNPDISDMYIYNYTYDANNTWYKESYWNVLLSAENESFDYTKVNEGTGEKSWGYAFLDAVYSDLESYVAVTIDASSYTGSADVQTLLSNLHLLIQGDASVNYGTMAEVSTPVIPNTDGTYTLYYSCETIKDLLASSTGEYGSAADAFADYNSIVLELSGAYYLTEFSAKVTDFDVVTRKYSLSSTYLETDLLGTLYYGTPYTTTDSTTGDTVYYTETLNSLNNWTVSYANLPISVNINGTTYYYYYYFLETSHSGGSVVYTTTYSQREGENGGGEIVISNIATTFVLPTTGWSGNYQTLYEFGILLILLALVGAGAYWNISRIRKSLVSEPAQEKVPQHGKHPKRLPDVRNRKFVIPRIVRKGDTRAGPDG